MGRIATATTIIPIPPSHCNIWRYRRIDWGNSSRPTRTVPPDDVSPEMDSNIAPMGVTSSASVRAKGSAPNSPSTVQNREVIKNPSRIRNSWLALRTGNHISRPEKKIIPIAEIKPAAVWSVSSNASSSGVTSTELKHINRIPRIRKETEKCMA